MTCTELIQGSLIDLSIHAGGGIRNQHITEPHFLLVPCGLSTRCRCEECDRSVCRIHLVAMHSHNPAAQRKVRRK